MARVRVPQHRPPLPDEVRRESIGGQEDGRRCAEPPGLGSVGQDLEGSGSIRGDRPVPEGDVAAEHNQLPALRRTLRPPAVRPLRPSRQARRRRRGLPPLPDDPRPSDRPGRISGW